MKKIDFFERNRLLKGHTMWTQQREDKYTYVAVKKKCQPLNRLHNVYTKYNRDILKNLSKERSRNRLNLLDWQGKCSVKI